MAEIPAPADDPSFYARGRGYPIAVHYGGALGDLTEISLTLERADDGKPVSGTLFAPETPYHPHHNDTEAVFVADNSLRGSTWYLARFRATDLDGPFEVSWWFSTGSGNFPTRTGRRCPGAGALGAHRSPDR